MTNGVNWGQLVDVVVDERSDEMKMRGCHSVRLDEQIDISNWRLVKVNTRSPRDHPMEWESFWPDHPIGYGPFGPKRPKQLGRLGEINDSYR